MECLPPTLYDMSNLNEIRGQMTSVMKDLDLEGDNSIRRRSVHLHKDLNEKGSVLSTMLVIRMVIPWDNWRPSFKKEPGRISCMAEPIES